MRVDPSLPGFRWWMYRRPPMDLPTGGTTPLAGAPDHRSDGSRPSEEPAPSPHDPSPAGTWPVDGARSSGPPPDGSPRSPVVPLLVGVAVLLALVVTARADLGWFRPALVVVAGLALARGAGTWLVRAHPSEAWLRSWLVAAVAVKLVASYARYWTLIYNYEGVGDATMYDDYGTRFVEAWTSGGAEPDLADLRQTNFIRWFTGVVYYLFGEDMLAAFFVFGLIAVVGSYLWYRATVDALPFVDRRAYLAVVLFVPSIAFWPSAIGKEALMQLGIGVMAVSTSLLVRNALARGLLVGLAGGWLLWVVRPHLLALVALAGGIAYIVGRTRSRYGTSGLLSKPLGMIVVSLLLVVAVSEGAEFLGMEDLSLSSIEAELDEQTERSAQGGSRFDNDGASLNPVHLPKNAVTVLLRPFPWEVDSAVQLLASLEAALLALAIAWRLPSLRAAVRRSLSHPFLMYCWILTGLYAATFASFANFGLLVRQRSLVLPALFVLLVVRVGEARAAGEIEEAERSRSEAEAEPTTPAARHDGAAHPPSTPGAHGR